MQRSDLSDRPDPQYEAPRPRPRTTDEVASRVRRSPRELRRWVRMGLITPTAVDHEHGQHGWSAEDIGLVHRAVAFMGEGWSAPDAFGAARDSAPL